MEQEHPVVAEASVYHSQSMPPRQRAEPPEQMLDERLLVRLLKMADSYCAASAPHQAIEMYFKLVESYAGTPQAAQAYECLLAIGDEYEDNGEFRQARAIFERLL